MEMLVWLLKLYEASLLVSMPAWGAIVLFDVWFLHVGEPYEEMTDKTESSGG